MTRPSDGALAAAYAEIEAWLAAQDTSTHVLDGGAAHLVESEWPDVLMVLSDRQLRWISAYHEAGHAFVLAAFQYPFESVYVAKPAPAADFRPAEWGAVRDIDWYAHGKPEEDAGPDPREWLFQQIDFCLAGRIAEELAFHGGLGIREPDMAGADYYEARVRARCVLKDKTESAVESFLQRRQEAVRRLLGRDDRWPLVKATARLLYNCGDATYEQVIRTMQEAQGKQEASTH